MLQPNYEFVVRETDRYRHEQAAKQSLLRTIKAQPAHQPGSMAKGIHWLGYHLEQLGLKLQQKQPPTLTDALAKQ